MRYAVHVHSSVHAQLQAYVARLPLPPRTPSGIPSDAHMRRLVRKWEALDKLRLARMRSHECALTRTDVENQVRDRIRLALVATHVRAHATVVARKTPMHL